MELAPGDGRGGSVRRAWLPLGGVTACFRWWPLIVIALDANITGCPTRLTLPLIPLGLAAAWAGLGPPRDDRAIGAAAGGLSLWLIAALYRLARGREGMAVATRSCSPGSARGSAGCNCPSCSLGAGLLGLLAILLGRARGRTVDASTRLPLGAHRWRWPPGRFG